ncbi:MAG: uroporphyrinogen decarboxylase family protein [Acidimicrobiales bacterium]
MEETFYPWDLTVRRFVKEGLPTALARAILDATPGSPPEKYLQSARFEGVLDYESWLGFDAVRRVAFTLPWRGLEVQVLDDTEDHTLYRDEGGRVIDLHKWSGVEVNDTYALTRAEDWPELEELARREEVTYYGADAIEAIYGPLRDGQARGEYSVRLHIEGFYWTPRELMGTQGLSYAFYDAPDLVHRVNQFALSVFKKHLCQVLEVLPADVLYVQEDISGTNGPLISPRMFDQFVAPYYLELVPMLRRLGVRHILVDTDGDFRRLIPNFMSVGVDGFLPMDVNAGMDIVSVRQEYPRLQFIGGFNKLCIADGQEAVDREFARLLPVIRQGGYIPGADHQVPPSTSLGDYRYYIARLGQVMNEAGTGSVPDGPLDGVS